MNLQQKHLHAAIVLPNVKINSAEIIQKLAVLCEGRLHAISAYPHSEHAQDKFAAIEEIRFALRNAKGCLNPKDSVRICLNLELPFHRIAPSATSTLCKNFFKRFNPLMDECRAYLERRAQV